MKLKIIAVLLLSVLLFSACTNKNGNGDVTTDGGNSVTDDITGTGTGTGAVDSSDLTVGTDTGTDTEAETPAGNTASLSDSLDVIMSYLVTDAGINFMLSEGEVLDDYYEHFFFIEKPEDAEAYYSEAMINSIPHSVALIKLPDEESAETAEASIKENLDPRKWVCVEAEASNVVRRGNIILLALSSTDVVDTISERFNNLV